MSDYSEEIASAQEEIEEAGGEMLLEWTLPGQFDEITGRMSDAVPASKPIFGLIEDALAAAKFFVGTSIQAGDMKVTIPAYANLIPQPGWRLTITATGEVWSVKQVGRFAPGGQVIMWPLLVTA